MGKSHLKWMEKIHKHIVTSVVNIFGPAHLQIIGLIGFLSRVKTPEYLPVCLCFENLGLSADSCRAWSGSESMCA